MEDVYILNHDCIRVVQNIEYVKLKYYFNIQLIHKLFYSDLNPIRSLHIEVHNYNNSINQRIRSNSNNLTSLKIECNLFSKDIIELNFIHLQKIKIVTDPETSGNIPTFSVLLNLTYLSISSMNKMNYNALNLKHCTHLKYLKLRNVIFNNNNEYFEKAINLMSLIRIFAELGSGEVKLHYQNNSRLKYLKLNKIKRVELHGMTQLETKILNDVTILKED